MERNIKRVKMSGIDVTKNGFIKNMIYFYELPDFTILFNYYKWIFSKQEKKHKLIVLPISIRKNGKLYIVGTQTEEKEFTNKKKAIDYFYDEIIKKEWLNIPEEIRLQL